MCDVLQGLCCFDEFFCSLDIVLNMFIWCLNVLVEVGLFECQFYSQCLLCYQYVFMVKGEDFCVVFMVFVVWGNCYYVEEGQSVQFVE